ncbi:MAG: M18 family aminopeptidase [Prevotella sp.]|uniref:M18 family aminopeptidase n=1 Tax=Leyella stercorea TaxID=363265 RepID=UPI001F443403|nr:M18 family aminopeptidase [Leyella stercorea]MCI6132285.1 M18 family aminopeptidase [Prevotella sp.]MCF2613930.1 M18 family aminopeptidase [Leyella stercorea]MCI6717914.1 M18 family aminopeptidase [Prevotella sp.]MCI6898285.1 M18 family aminopeptidase [Prevotella sp.]MCI7198729.1 M18 family aminopeptidase [Prevotella sp.]
MIKRLLSFLDASPVNFLAVKNIADTLLANGFRRVDPSQPLGEVKSGDRFFVTKNDSSVFAFRIGNKPIADAGFHMICAHCDSPTFRIKPNAEMLTEGGIVKLNTEVYGGPIMSTWFDRPLTLAGRVIVRGEDVMQPQTLLLHIKRPLLQISNLAIHFNRQVNDGVALSKQKDVLPLLGQITSQLEAGNLLMNVILEELNSNAAGRELCAKDILDFDLYLADATPACTFGVHNEFISSGRLDDLSMCYAGLEALIASDTTDTTQVLALFDNEETGSQTKQGAGSPFLSFMLKRIALAQSNTEEAYYQAVERAFMISADNAHAWHPNYPEKYDPTNHPMLGGGPVIKFNAAQKYASDAVSAAVFAGLCEKAGVPCQRFVNHSDVAGGSTLGNILASSIPLRGVDMGNAILAMHSCRETGSVADHVFCVKVFTEFYS